MLQEYFYYKAHQEEIIKDHMDEYVSIMGDKVLGYYKNTLTGFDATRKLFPTAEHFFIRKCRPVGESDELVIANSNEDLVVSRA